MSVLNPNEAFRKTLYGARVTSEVTVIAETADKPLFTITGGRVIITSLVGEVTDTIQAQANDVKVKFNPTASGADTDLCAALEINGDAIGTLYGVSGDYSVALQQGVLTLEGPAFGAPFILSEGDIELDTVADSTGEIEWTLTYVPYDDGAVVASA
jgi:hypothetical protein